MDDYLQQIKSITNMLTTIASPLDKEDIILYTLNGLSSQYNPFKTAI